MKGFEDVCVFYKHLPTYNPQEIISIPKKLKIRKSNGAGEVMGKNGTVNKEYFSEFTNYPNTTKEQVYHPTGKSVKLLEYLIKTYSNENDLILDNCMGSGSTIIGCLNTNRKYIGIEKDNNYFNIAEDRINNWNKENINKTDNIFEF